MYRSPTFKWNCTVCHKNILIFIFWWLNANNCVTIWRDCSLKMTNLPWFTHSFCSNQSNTKRCDSKMWRMFCSYCECQGGGKAQIQLIHFWSKVSSFILHRRKLAKQFGITRGWVNNDWIFLLKGTIPLTLSCLWHKWWLDKLFYNPT